jgi:CSLREA domain-containing protein
MSLRCASLLSRYLAAYNPANPPPAMTIPVCLIVHGRSSLQNGRAALVRVLIREIPYGWEFVYTFLLDKTGSVCSNSGLKKAVRRNLAPNSRQHVSGSPNNPIMKRPTVFWSLIGFTFLLGAVALCAAIDVEETPQPAFGTAFLVNSTGDQGEATPDNQCETVIGNGVCTLRAAIELVNSRNNGGDGIFFSIPSSDPGCSGGVCTITLGSALPDLSAPVNISGPGAANLFVSHPGDPSRDTPFPIFNVTASGTVNISNLTIGGLGAFDVTNPGTGLQNSSTGTVNITGCTISYNLNSSTFNAKGGGIHNDSGTVQITNSTIEFNEIGGDCGQLSLGGGLYNGNGTIKVVNSTFNHNNADLGGGIFNSSGVVTVTSSTFHDDGASDAGGGISGFGGTVNVTNSTFYANIAYSKKVGSLTGASGGGGAIYNVNASTLNLTNSTISANFSATGGSGVSNGGTANVKSTIIAANHGGIGVVGTTSTTAIIGASPDVNGAFNSQGFNLIGKKDGSTGFSAATDKKGTVASPLNPLLDPKGLRNNGGPTQTVALVRGSPAIDKGTSNGLTGTLTTDQRGFARTVDKSVADATGGDGTDIGAFELQ